MSKIATPQEMQGELREILAYTQTEQPSRAVTAAKLRELAEQITGGKVAGELTRDNVELATEIIAQGMSHRVFDGVEQARRQLETSTEAVKARAAQMRKMGQGDIQDPSLVNGHILNMMERYAERLLGTAKLLRRRIGT